MSSINLNEGNTNDCLKRVFSFMQFLIAFSNKMVLFMEASLVIKVNEYFAFFAGVFLVLLRLFTFEASFTVKSIPFRSICSGENVGPMSCSAPS